MTQQTAIATEQPSAIQPLVLEFEEGQAVILRSGAKIGGLVTKCNQPGKIVHIQYSDEFGRFTYCVAFGTMQRMYAYVSATGIEAIAEVAPAIVPLLDQFEGEVDPGDYLAPVLDPIETMDVIGKGDLVKVFLSNRSQTPLFAKVVQVMSDGARISVKSPNGVNWSGSVDNVQVILKASALALLAETKTTTEVVA